MINHRTLPTCLLALLVSLSMLTGVAEAQLLKRAMFAQADEKVVEPVVPAVEEKPAVTPKPEDGTPPAQPPAVEGGQALVIKIVGVAGTVQVRSAPDQKWEPAKAGMIISIGTEIRTGLRSVCKFTIDGNHEVTLDRLGVVKVLDAINKDGRVKTDVGMKYGRTQYKVETGAADHDAKVHAPSATLAVRGSFVTLEDNDAFGSLAIVDHSRNASYKSRGPDGSLRVVAVGLIKGRIEQDKDDAGKQPPTAAQMALQDTINDIGDRLAKANDLERELVGLYPVYNGAGGAGGLPSVKELLDQTNNVFQNEIEPGGSVAEGFLEIFASWSGSDSIVLFAHDPLGGRLSSIQGQPSGFDTIVRSGGPAPGSASGGSFDAQLLYPNGIPVGGWNIGIAVVGTPTGPTSYVIDVLRSGGSEPVGIESFEGVLDSGNTIDTHQFNVPFTPPPDGSVGN